jgi:polygalacturonase
LGLIDELIGNQSIPTFPQNTDGIDPSGTNITMRNLIITSYDDAVAVKSAH